MQTCYRWFNELTNVLNIVNKEKEESVDAEIEKLIEDRANTKEKNFALDETETNY